jgi:zinc D-Ala-D-Ala carboxypeptidase
VLHVRRGLGLLAGVLPAVLLLPAPAAASKDARAVDVTAAQSAVERLRSEVDAVAEELGAAATALEDGQARLDALRQQEYRTGEAVRDVQQDLRSAQARMDALARAAYRGSGYPQLTALLNGDLQALSDYRYLQEGLQAVSAEHETVVADLSDARSDAVRLEEQTVRDRESAQALQAQLDADTEALRERALDAQRRLEEAGAALRRAEAEEALRRAEALRAAAAREAAARLAAAAAVSAASSGLGGGAPTCRTPVVGDAVNGFLSADQLCALSAPGQQLAVGAAQAFEAMSAAYAAAFGSPLCVSDSYRDYTGQVDVFRRKPALAATPGRSQHGLARAVDLCGGVESFGTPQHRWMQANAGRFGFVHPRWAQVDGSRPEAWHWEWAG